MEPQMYGSEELAKRPLLEAPRHDSSVRYRRVLEEEAEKGETDVTASTLLTNRSFLDAIRHSLRLSPQEASEIEFQTLQPARDYRQRIQTYEEKFSRTTLGQDVSNPKIRLNLKQLQKALGLTDSDTAAIDAAPYVAEQQMQREQYQKSLALYEQVLLTSMRRQFPLAESDRQMLDRWQQVLQLREDDVQAIQNRLTAQIHRHGDASASHPETTYPDAAYRDAARGAARDTATFHPDPFIDSESSAGTNQTPTNLQNMTSFGVTRPPNSSINPQHSNPPLHLQSKCIVRTYLRVIKKDLFPLIKQNHSPLKNCPIVLLKAHLNRTLLLNLFHSLLAQPSRLMKPNRLP